MFIIQSVILYRVRARARSFFARWLIAEIGPTLFSSRAGTSNSHIILENLPGEVYEILTSLSPRSPYRVHVQWNTRFCVHTRMDGWIWQECYRTLITRTEHKPVCLPCCCCSVFRIAEFILIHPNPLHFAPKNTLVSDMPSADVTENYSR